MKVLLLEGGKRPSRQTRDELDAKGIQLTSVQDVGNCLTTLGSDKDHTVIVDLDLHRKGVEAIKEIHKAFPDVVLLVMASLERLTVVDEALKQGAWDFVIKQPDFSHLQEVPQAITRSLERKTLQEEAKRLREEAERYREEAKKLQAESERFREETKWLRIALQGSRDAIWVAEPQGKIIFANPVLYHRLGYDGDDLIGKSVATVLGSLETEESSWTEASEPFPHRQWQGKTVIKKKDGSKLEVTARLTKILDEGGKTKALIGVCPQSEESRPTSEVSRDVGGDELLADIADDLKSPLAAMIGYLEIASTISPDRVESSQILSIQRIEALARRLFDLVMNHSEALDIETGRFEIQKNVLDLNEILEMTVQVRKNEASAKNIEIVLETAPDLPAVSLDPVQIERAVGILISNAIGLSPMDGTVVVNSQLHSKEIAVAIKDSGGGIFEEEIPFLFDRKKRLRRRGADVSTVGLYVARHIVDAHGGRIEVQSNPMEGTTFTIFLPV